MSALLFAHGAGVSSSHPWMETWARRLERFAPVIPFDYPYMQAGKKFPDRMPVLLEAHRSALAAARARHGDNVVLIGKSLGSRVGCILSSEVTVPAVICLGYPLVGQNKAAPLRDAPLRALRCPALFVQGDRDRLCPLDTLMGLLPELVAPTGLHVVPDGDHSLRSRKRPLKAAGITQDHLDDAAVDAIGSFLSEHLGW